MNILKQFILFTATLPLFANNTLAADFFPATAVDFKNALVSAATNNQNDTIHLPAATLKVSDNGNNPFEYNSNENFSLTISGNSQVTSVLDGTGKRLLKISSTGGNSANVTLQHLTIQNGDGVAFAAHGGAFISTDDGTSSSASITVNDVLFTNNLGHDGGGLTAWSRNGAITITNTTFHQNYANNDGGAFYIYSYGGPIRLDNVSSLNNSAKSTYAGGRMVCYAECFVEHSNFDSNITTLGAMASVGGLSIASVNTDVTISDVLFSYNESADSQVGALVIEDNSADTNSITVRNSQFVENKAGTSIGGAYIISNAGNIFLENNEFRGNTSNSTVGGFYIQGLQPNVDILKNKIVMNKSANDYIGGFGISTNGLVNIENNVIARNETGPDSRGAGIHILSESGTFNLLNNTIIQNVATAEGGGIYVEPQDDNTHFVIANNIITDNQAATGGDIAIKAATFTTDIKLINNALSDFCLDNDCSLTQLGCNASNNISAAPFFVDVDNGDLRLANGSPYVDAGASLDNLPGTDIVNNLRVNGLAPDLGAYESDQAIESNVASNLDPECVATDPDDATPADSSDSAGDSTDDTSDALSGSASSGGGCSLSQFNNGSSFQLLIMAISCLLIIRGILPTKNFQ